MCVCATATAQFTKPESRRHTSSQEVIRRHTEVALNHFVILNIKQVELESRDGVDFEVGVYVRVCVCGARVFVRLFHERTNKSSTF